METFRIPAVCVNTGHRYVSSVTLLLQRREGVTYLQSVETFYSEIVMSDEKLVELVRGYEEHYDMSHKKYSYVKENIWIPFEKN